MGNNDNTGIGKEVRAAYDGPSVEHDDLISQIEARAAEEYARASDSSESAARVSAFLEKTSLNSQAFSWAKSILKKLPKKDGQAKAMDVIRSLETILPMLKNHVGGQETPDMLDGYAPDQDAGKDDLDRDQADFDATASEVPKSAVMPIDFGGQA